jgi:hypothetical protein
MAESLGPCADQATSTDAVAVYFEHCTALTPEFLAEALLQSRRVHGTDLSDSPTSFSKIYYPSKFPEVFLAHPAAENGTKYRSESCL